MQTPNQSSFNSHTPNHLSTRQTNNFPSQPIPIQHNFPRNSQVFRQPNSNTNVFRPNPNNNRFPKPSPMSISTRNTNQPNQFNRQFPTTNNRPNFISEELYNVESQDDHDHSYRLPYPDDKNNGDTTEPLDDGVNFQ